MFGEKNKVICILAIVLSLLFFICGALVSLNRYWQFDVWYYDFGIFNQAIWSVSRFKLPIIDHFIVPGKVIFADHFNPSIFILSPLYWFTDRAEILLVAQAFFVAASGLILYYVGCELLEDKVSPFFVMLSYYLFTGLQNAVITEFHELTIMTPFLSLLYLCYVKRKKRLFILTFLIILGFKESLFTLGLGLGIYIFFSRKDWSKVALFIIFFSIFWAFSTTKFIIPLFSGRSYYYTPQLTLKTLFTDGHLKLSTILISLGTFLFLPLGTLWLYPLYIFHFATRFFSEGSTRWGLGLHYSAEIAPSLAFGVLITLQHIKTILSSKYVRILSVSMVLVSFFLFRFILHGPFLLAFNPVFYQHTKVFTYLEKLVDRVPLNGSVSAQNNLALRFYKQRSYILTDTYQTKKPDYILMDMRPGQNPNNFLGIKDEVKLLERIKSDKSYGIFFHENDQYIFKKISS